MSMKICNKCNKSLVNRKRLVNPDKNSMRCRDCSEPDIYNVAEIPAIQEGPTAGTVAKPNYITKKHPRKRNNQDVSQAVNGEIAKGKHYVRAKSKIKPSHPTIDEKYVKKHDKNKSNS